MLSQSLQALREDIINNNRKDAMTDPLYLKHGPLLSYRDAYTCSTLADGVDDYKWAKNLCAIAEDLPEVSM